MNQWQDMIEFFLIARAAICVLVGAAIVLLCISKLNWKLKVFFGMIMVVVCGFMAGKIGQLIIESVSELLKTKIP